MGIPEVDPTAGSPMLRIGARLTSPKPVRWTLKHVAHRIDRPLLRLSKGRLSSAMVTPEVLLIHTGARTGKRRTTPLTYFTDGGRVIVIASNYGGSRHPAWYFNVTAHPRVTLSAGGHTGDYVAEEVTGDERARLWRLACEFIPSYAGYEQLAGDRTIPVIAFTPAP
ncbi:nitroreductase/quinone reductase family protein [Mycobacterium sp. NPDC050551]|uniref:nitroreductase/quinone reductase family protein n=1 Tax=Mycobacterium sp. NPDC050551 TaxID=3155407 RepID=UPI003441D892